MVDNRIQQAVAAAGPKSTGALVEAFLAPLSRPTEDNSAGWLSSLVSSDVGPTDLMDAIQQALWDEDIEALPEAIMSGLAFALSEAPAVGERFEQPDRLPLYRAKQEAGRFKAQPMRAFMRHVIENWVLAQHVYWSVGRGLADARARGRQLLRLKVVLEEHGWELAPGTQPPSAPSPTPDRLHTALVLASECGAMPSIDQ